MNKVRTIQHVVQIIQRSINHLTQYISLNFAQIGQRYENRSKKASLPKSL